jgi:beta-lactamase class A
MIIFSDNTATNVLIDLLGMDEINGYINSLGFEKTRLNRKMYDVEKSGRGIQNYITASETGRLLTMMHREELVSEAASRQMISILKNQQLCSKIPFYLQALSEEPEIAHKTGEDRGITHDVGIVYGKVPFLVCFCGNETDTPGFERIMGELSLKLYKQINGMEKQN